MTVAELIDRMDLNGFREATEQLKRWKETKDKCGALKRHVPALSGSRPWKVYCQHCGAALWEERLVRLPRL